MAWFKCVIHGQNFPGRLLGKQKTAVNFYATRVVQASNSIAAEIRAVAYLKRDPTLKLPRIIRKGNARVNFDSVEHLPDHHYLIRRRPKGFTFYIVPVEAYLGENEEVPTADPLLTAQEAALVATLTQAQVASIDAALMSHAKAKPRKVAMIVGLAMNNQPDRVPGIPDLFYAERVRKLVASGLLIAQGNLAFMSFSEVRLP